MDPDHAELIIDKRARDPRRAGRQACLPARLAPGGPNGNEAHISGYTIRLAEGQLEWNQLLLEAEHQHMTQAWAYGEAKKAAGGTARTSRGLTVSRLVFESKGRPVAICQVLERALAGVRLASRANRGPLFLTTEVEEAVTEGVFVALRRGWQNLAHGILLLAPALPAGDASERLLRRAGFRARHVSGWRSTVLDLELDPELLRVNLAATWRNRLRLAERSALTCSVTEERSALAWLLAKHVENMRAKHFVGPPRTFLEALCDSTPGGWFIVQAVLPGASEPVGAMLVYLFGTSAEYYVGWFGDAGKRVSAGNLLYWHAALEAQRRGCTRFDLGGYDAAEESGLRRFKQGMRGEHYELVHEWMVF